jgi:hypothetical protein
MRPDGYGLVRVADREFGFFLEFDRGTIRPAALRAKFAAYQRYMSTPRAERDFTGFPMILVVTSGPSGEQRIIDALRAVSVAEGRRLPVLVTTAEWLRGNAAGAFGRIWLASDRGPRRDWPHLSHGVVLGAERDPTGKTQDHRSDLRHSTCLLGTELEVRAPHGCLGGRRKDMM